MEQGLATVKLKRDPLLWKQFKILGKIIVHSMLQEGPGFPLFPEAVFHY